MRILLVNHGSAGEWGGGDGVQIRETERAAKRGHDVVSVNADQPDCRGLTLFIQLSCQGRSITNGCCKAADVPVAARSDLLARAYGEAAQGY